MMEKLLYLITEGFKNIWRHKITSFTAVFSLFLTLVFIGLMATAGNNTHKILQYLRAKYKVEVFFRPNFANEEAIGVIHKIKKIPGVRTATLIEKDDALRIFKDQFGEDIISLLGYNPLPVSAVVNLKRNSENPIKAGPIVKKINSMNGVEEVRYQGHLIKKIERTYYRILDKIPYIAGLIVFVSFLIIYNTIKLSVYSRKELIKSLELIGATSLFIKMPFLFEGLIIGFLSSAIAIPGILSSVGIVNYILSNFTSWGIRISLDPTLWIWMFIISISISVFGSYRAASSILE